MHTFLITSHLRALFHAIGAYVRAVPQTTVTRTRWSAAAVANRPRINVRNEAFELALPSSTRAVVLDCRKSDQHLVLSLQDEGAAPQRFLCGFDERHWFAAAVTGHTVAAAKDSLMPPEVLSYAARVGLRHGDFHRRHTKAFIRQGEWFFVPVGDIEVDELTIHRREPLVRPGGGKPHLVDELIRGTGEMVWHHAYYAPNGFTNDEYACLHAPVRAASGWSRRMRVRVREAGSVLARGGVRHPDHATIWLSGWHRVFINREVRPASLGFLD